MCKLVKADGCGAARCIVVVAMGLCLGTAYGGLVENFDPASAPATAGQFGTAPGPAVLPGGPTGDYLRLVNNTGNQQNGYAFRQTDAGRFVQTVAEFDFRGQNKADPADGFCFLLTPTAIYGTSGPGAYNGSFPAEEPNVAGAFAIGFDLYPESSANDVSAHWSGTEFANVTLPNSDIDLNAGVFHRARVELTSMGVGANVSVTLIPDVHGTPGTPVAPIANVYIPTLTPYDQRVEFGGRTGGAYLDVDLDNVNVQYVAQPAFLYQDFEGGGTIATPQQRGSAPGPAVLGPDAGSTGNFLRLTNDGVNNQNNGIAFDQTPDQAMLHPRAIVDFDFRCSSPNDDAADGFSLVFLPTDTYGATGPGAAGTFTAEEPSLAGALAIGFDLHPAGSVNDVSVHWDGTELLNITVPIADIDLDAGVFHHAEVAWMQVAGGSEVTVTLTPDINGLIGASVTPIASFLIPGLDPYSYRLEYVGRTGGLNVGIDLDNISVFTIPEPSTLGLAGLGLLALVRRRRRSA